MAAVYVCPHLYVVHVAPLEVGWGVAAALADGPGVEVRRVGPGRVSAAREQPGRFEPSLFRHRSNGSIDSDANFHLRAMRTALGLMPCFSFSVLSSCFSPPGSIAGSDLHTKRKPKHKKAKRETRSL